MAYVYAKGSGVPRDYATAWFWTRVARRSVAPGQLPLSPQFEQQLKQQITADVAERVETQVDDWLREHPVPHREWFFLDQAPADELTLKLREVIP